MSENAMIYRHLTIRNGKLVVLHEGPMNVNKAHPDYEKYFGKREGKVVRKPSKGSRRRKAA